tara:strand:+ start:496 stop:651 length:156 start_codon:yes stop_codon:yes gene_type:complete
LSCLQVERRPNNGAGSSPALPLNYKIMNEQELKEFDEWINSLGDKNGTTNY